MLEFLLLSLLGVLLGVFTGLIPGLHPNTVVFISLPLYLSSNVSLPVYISLITSMAVSHSFHDFLPSIVLGVPEAESAMASIPGADMASEGNGIQAFYATLKGGLFSVTLLVLLLPFFFLFLEDFYGLIESSMAFLLLFLLFFLLMYSKSKKDSFLIITLSGLLGLAVFSAPVNQNYVFLPVFSGLFAVPAILKGLRNNFELPDQRSGSFEFESSVSGYLGTLGGILAGILPGMGAATATTFMIPWIESEEDFLTSMGAINTSDAILSFVSLLLIEKARSGSAVALNQVARIDIVSMTFSIGISLFSVSLSGVIAFNLGSRIFKLLKNIEFRKLLLASFFIILISTFMSTRLLGLLILATSSAIGYAAAMNGMRRCCMAVLILPALEFYAVDLFL